MIGVCIAGYFFFTGLVTLIDMLAKVPASPDVFQTCR